MPLKGPRKIESAMFLHAICSLISILDFNSKFKVLQNSKVPKPENKVLNLEYNVTKEENKYKSRI